MLLVGKFLFCVLCSCFALEAAASFSRYRILLEASSSSGSLEQSFSGVSSQRRGLKFAQLKQAPAPAPASTGGLPAPAPPAESALVASPTVVSTVATSSAQEASATTGSANSTVESGTIVTANNVTVNSTEWALSAQQDISASKANSSDCDCTTSPAAPYSEALTTTQEIMVEPITVVSPAEQQVIDEARDQAALDCQVSDWQDWGGCQTDPSSGLKTHMQARVREVLTPQQEGGGVCPPLSEVKACTADGFISDTQELT